MCKNTGCRQLYPGEAANSVKTKEQLKQFVDTREQDHDNVNVYHYFDVFFF